MMMDRTFAGDALVAYRLWPETPDGVIELGEFVDGEMQVSTRLMTVAEVDEWHARNPPEPLVAADARVDDDELQASVALLTEDSVGYRAVIGLLLAKGLITEAEVGAAQTAATDRLVTLADNPGVRRQMMADRIARAEAARGR